LIGPILELTEDTDGSWHVVVPSGFKKIFEHIFKSYHMNINYFSSDLAAKEQAAEMHPAMREFLGILG